MKFKLGFIFICLIICLFSVASVCASDANETFVANENLNNDLIEINDENDNILAIEEQDFDEVGEIEVNQLNTSTGTYTDLANEIANAGDELNLTKDYIYSTGDGSYKEGIFIHKKITINGNGFTINGTNHVSAFQIYSEGVILNNIKFVDCYKMSDSLNVYGGAINWEGPNGILNNCSFNNCHLNTGGSNSHEYGCAVYWSGISGVLSDCTFVNCYGSRHSAAYGAVYWSGADGILKNSTFERCHMECGGAIYWAIGSNGTLINCTFVDCYSNWYGGAVYWSSNNGKLINCSFISCYSSSQEGGGGSIYWSGSKGVLEDCSFEGSYTMASGGAIYWNGAKGVLKNCNFENCRRNSAGDSSLGGDGGAIYWRTADGILSNCRFKLCKAEGFGGAIYCIGDNPTFIQCNFTNNYANAGKAIWFNRQKGTIIKSNIKNGDIYNIDKFIIIDGSPGTFTDLAKEIRISGDELTLYRDYIYSTNDDSLYEYGINISKPITIDGAGAIINGNNLSRAFYITANNVILKNIIFINCRIDFGQNINISESYKDAAGCIYWQGKNGQIINSTFINCSSSEGGAIFSIGSNLKIIDSIFINNTASFYSRFYGGMGGAIWFGSLNGLIENCQFINNSILNITDWEFQEPRGSAIYGADNNIFINNSYFYYNHGNAICLAGDNATVSNSQFLNNANGTIRSYSSEAKLINSTFINNTAEGDVIYWIDGYVYKCIFENNVGKISIPILNTKIEATDMTAIYNSEKYLIIMLKDIYDNPITDVNLSINITGVKNYTTDEKGTIKVPINDLPANNYTAEISFNGSDFYIESNATVKLIINKANSTLTFNDIIFDYNTSGSCEVSFEWASDIDVSIINHTEAIVNYVDGKITVSGLDAGNYTLSVTTIPDANHNAVTKTANITVNKIDSTLTVDNIELNYNDSGSCEVSFEWASDIDVSIINHTEAIVNYVDGKITVSGLDAGNYTLSVTTIPDANHNAVTKTADVRVNKINSSVTLLDISFDYNNFGSVNVTLDGATGVNAKISGINASIVNYADGKITVSGLEVGNYTLSVTTIPDANHYAVTKTSNIIVNKADSSVNASDIVFNYGSYGSTKITLNGANDFIINMVNKDNSYLTKNADVISVFGLDAGIYQLEITTLPDNNHNAVIKILTITVNKLKTNILSSSQITTTYGNGKKISMSLKDANGDILVNKSVIFKLNNINYNTKTDSNGQASIIIPKNLAVKTYIAYVTFGGETNYDNSTFTVKVVVKKATPKLTAKAKTFKKSVKTKKYAVTLKDNTGKVMKKVKLTLKIKGKTFKATTNTKGKATFKITKFTKKGTFKAVVAYKGNAYYNKVTKKVKIKVK